MSDETKILNLEAVEAIRDWVKDNFVTKNDLTNFGLVSQLYVTFDEDFVGQTYMITGADKTYSGIVPESLEVIALVDTANTTYTVTCPNDEGTECTCEVKTGSKTGRYAGKLECFKAYLRVKTEAGATVTATIDDYSYAGTAGEDGYCTLTVKRKGTYSVVAKLGIRVSEAVPGEANENGATVKLIVTLPDMSWAKTSDEKVAEIIDKARAGEIDLQADLGWKVGDTRTIHIGAFTGSNDVNNEEQDIDIVISSFEDYEGCGCKMQFDFKTTLVMKNRMNESKNSGGYKSSEMFTTTLPNLVEVLPTWLKERLLEFTVKTSAGSQSNTIESIEGNKLALRSEVEVYDSTFYSAKGEGTQIEYYKTEGNRNKNYKEWWLRSPYKSSDYDYCLVYINGTIMHNNAYCTYGIAPFGCL